MNVVTNVWATLSDLIVSSGKIEWNEDKINRTPKKQLRLQLFLISFLILFIELALIRWVPSSVRYMGYFLNFILLASFLGIGVGILSSRRQKLWFPPFPLLLFVLTAVISKFNFVLVIPSEKMIYYTSLSDQLGGNENFLILPLIFALVAATIFPLGRVLGRLLTSLPPLEAYGFDIAGSLAGTAAFFVVSWFSLSPIWWFSLAAILYLLTRAKKFWALALPLLAGTLYIVYAMGANSYFSPYYKIDLHPTYSDKQEFVGYGVSVNSIGHQGMTKLEYRGAWYFKAYGLLPDDHPLEHVLIIGSGTGSDVAVALEQGVQKVTAVEIDPLLYQLGEELNPLKPYSDPRVNVIINDGRFYLNNTDEEFDLIIFGLPDSLTLTSGFASVRLESFLLTQESLEAAKERLSDNGVLVLYNSYREEWFIHKLAYTMELVFEEKPYVTAYGSAGKAAVLAVGPGLSPGQPFIDDPYQEGMEHPFESQGYDLPVLGEGRLSAILNQTPPTDNWPFIYLEDYSLPLVYLAALGTIIVITLGFVAGFSPSIKIFNRNWHFFFLGVAFLLLETRSLVTFALLFGTTWMVNSLVFFAILSSVLLAILFNAKFKIKRVNWLYALLLGSIVLNYLLPIKSMLTIESPVLRYGLVSIVAFIPIFLANIIFTESFQNSQEADAAFGANLLGAMLGGMLEYTSLLLGYKSLLVIVFIMYVLAFIFWRKSAKRTIGVGVSSAESM
jgi:hypothetical protein